MRFCLLTTFYPPYSFGGDAIFVHRLAQALSRRGHHVEVVHCLDSYHALAPPGGPGAAPPNPGGVQVHSLESGWGALSPLLTQQTGQPFLKRKAIERILASGRFDVLHFHNISLLGGAGLLKLGTGIKLYTTHEHWLVCPTHVLFKFRREPCERKQCFSCQLAYRRPPQWWRYTNLLRNSLGHVHALLCPGRFTLERHEREKLGRPLIHLPYFYEPDGIEEEPVELPDRPFFLFAGRLERLKGLHEVLPLWRDYPLADFLIAGRGEQQEELERLASGAGHIRFLGPLRAGQLQYLYRRALACIICSLTYEVMPLVFLEAQALGAPVIVKNLGVLPELVAESGGGLVYQDAESLRHALDRLRREPGLRNELGENARRAWQRLWSEEAHMARYFQVIKRFRP